MMRTCRCSTVLALSLTVVATAVEAQSVRGRVMREGTGAPVPGAEVMIVSAEQHVVVTDSTGAYLLDDLADGWQIIQVRKVGFVVRRDTVNIRGEITRDFLLSSQTSLDTVRTVSSSLKYSSPGLRGFEERRARKESGYFIPEEELRKGDQKSLAGFIAQHVSGLTPISPSGNATNLVSSRTSCSGPVFLQKGGSCQRCYVTTYVDGLLIYQSTERTDLEPPDFNRFPVSDYAAVEYYPSSATAPMQYNATGQGASCGVLLLWTREK